MTAYTKTMAQALQEVYIEENNMAKMKKAASGSMQTLKMKDGNLQMDKVTASAIMAVYNAVNPKNKKTMENMLSTGKKSDIMKLQKFALSKTKMTNASYNMEEFEEVQEAMVNTNSVSMLDLMDLFDKAMSAKPGSDEQAKWKGQIRKLKKSMGVKEEVDLDEDYVLTVKGKEVNRYKSEKDARKAFHDLVQQHGQRNVKVFKEEVELDEGTWHIAKNMNALKKKMQKPIPKNDLMVKFVMKHIGDDELADEMFDAKTGTDMVPMIKSAMKRLNIKEEVELDEKLDKDDEKVVKKVVDKLKKASQAHAGQSKDLQKAIDEDGHTDVASAQNNVKVAMSALTKMSGELSKLNPEDALPSWWTNKVAVAVDKLDGMADYLDTQVEEVDEDYVLTVKDKEVNRYKSEKDARKAFHDLVKQHGHRNVKVFKEEVELDESVIEQLKSLAKGGSRYKPKSGAVEIKDDKGKVINKLTPEGAKKVLDKMKDPISGKSSVPDRTRGGAEKKIIDIVKNFKEEADLDEASARGDAKRSMSRDRDLGRKDDLDKDDAASDDDVKAASKNIMMQLRKAANLRGTFAVEFGDKKKVKVDPKVAQAAASKYNSLRRPADKEKFQSQIAKSYKDMLKAIKEAVSPAQQAAIAISKKERGEKPKKESRFNTINKQLKGEK